MRRLIVGFGGASGAIYGVRFLRQAVRHFDEVYLMLSANAPDVIAQELGIRLDSAAPVETLLGGDAAKVRLCAATDFFSPPASGSFRHDGMVIVPCSLGTAGRIAAGISNDLTTRAADVCLKERRPLILVVRESPLNLIHLRNLTALTEAGATILPAAPSFYHAPRTIDDLVDSVVARILQNLGIAQNLVGEWGVEEP
jgi:4-hydroxy-3-polyprenylbenzoate decarboxylase